MLTMYCARRALILRNTDSAHHLNVIFEYTPYGGDLALWFRKELILNPLALLLLFNCT